LVIGLAETNGVNGLRRMWRLEATAQAIATPQVRKVIYLDAHDDLPTFLSNFRSLISQRVNMIMGAFDFGAAVLPVAKQAMRDGIDVISLEAIPNAKAGVDYGVQVGVVDECQTWSQEAQAPVPPAIRTSRCGSPARPKSSTPPAGPRWSPATRVGRPKASSRPVPR
jgi:ABC-type sugar transport system substrate-binding protein